MTSVMGQLKRDTSWAGDVRLTGDVFVPEGVTLRIEAGARISFDARPHWSCSVFWRPADRGESVEATARGLCDIVVQGALEIEGTDRSPACLGTDETPWGGITSFDHAQVRLTHAYLAGAPHFSVQSFDDAIVRATDTHLTGSEFAVWAWGTSQLHWTRGAIGATRASVIICEGARARIAGIEDRSGEGIAATDSALVRIDASRFCGPRKHCVVAKDQSWVKMKDCSTHEAPMDVVRLDEAHVEVRP